MTYSTGSLSSSPFEQRSLFSLFREIQNVRDIIQSIRAGTYGHRFQHVRPEETEVRSPCIANWDRFFSSDNLMSIFIY